MSILTPFDPNQQQEFQTTIISEPIASNQKLQSLDQLSKMYGTKSAFQIAQNVVYGVKAKQNKTQSSQRLRTQQSHLAPTKSTAFSHQLRNTLSNKKQDEDRENLTPASHRVQSTSQMENNVTNRLLQYRDVIDGKKEEMKEKIYQQVMQECTFQPERFGKSEVRSAEKFASDQHSYAQALQQRKEQALERKAQDELMVLQDTPSLGAKTERLAKARQSGTTVVDRLYCLSPSKMRSQALSTQQAEIDPSCSFRPEILQKSKNIQRSKPVEEYLFQDAKRRHDNQTLSMTQCSLQQQSSLSNSSTGWFVQRFIKEFYFQLSCLERIQFSEQKDYSRLTYSETLQVMQGLSYFPLKPLQSLQIDGTLQQLSLLWQHLSPKDTPTPSVLSRNLLVVLLAILSVPLQHTEIPKYRVNQSKEVSNMGESDPLFQHSKAELLQPDDREGGVQDIRNPKKIHLDLVRDESGNIKLDEGSAQYLHQNFYSLYLNTKQLSQGNSQRRQMARSPEPSQRMHSPRISDNSLQLSSNKRSQHFGNEREFDLNEWFVLQETNRKQKQQQISVAVRNAEMQECTFGQKRTTCTIDLNMLSRPHVKDQDKRAQDIEYSQQQVECTFQPQISRNLNGPQHMLHSAIPLQLQVNKTAERLKEGRARKQAIQLMREKGTTTNNKTRVQAKKTALNEQNHQQIKQRGPKSNPMFGSKKTSCIIDLSGCSVVLGQGADTDNSEIIGDNNYTLRRDHGDEDRVPLLFVDVNIEEGKTARIIVFEGDTSEELADKFSADYKLDISMKYKLKELLDAQINSLLTKIEEDVFEESDQELE